MLLVLTTHLSYGRYKQYTIHYGVLHFQDSFMGWRLRGYSRDCLVCGNTTFTMNLLSFLAFTLIYPNVDGVIAYIRSLHNP